MTAWARPVERTAPLYRSIAACQTGMRTAAAPDGTSRQVSGRSAPLPTTMPNRPARTG